MKQILSPALLNSRKESGHQLGENLCVDLKGKNILVLGIPMGGAEIAYWISAMLKAEFSLIISKKLYLPENPEISVGAVTEEGIMYQKEDYSHQGAIERIKEQSLAEVKRRIRILRNNKPISGMTNREVVIVDEGIITGATILPAIHYCKEKKASKVIVAAPFICEKAVDLVRSQCDDLRVFYILSHEEAKSFFGKTGKDISDERVIELLYKSNETKRASD